jgi:uncharacterized protein (UPF0332 family)
LPSSKKAELAIDLSSEAGRNAYLAAFHAARAFIFDRTGKVVKRHEGVHREFTRLAKDEPGIDKNLAPFLTQTYNMKAIADYDTTSALPSRPNTLRRRLKPQRVLLNASGAFSRRAAVLPHKARFNYGPSDNSDRLYRPRLFSVSDQLSPTVSEGKQRQATQH